MTNSRFAIVEIIAGFNNNIPTLPYRILEQYQCSDGYRTRIVDQAFLTKEEALAHLAF